MNKEIGYLGYGFYVVGLEGLEDGYAIKWGCDTLTPFDVDDIISHIHKMCACLRT